MMTQLGLNHSDEAASVCRRYDDSRSVMDLLLKTQVGAVLCAPASSPTLPRANTIEV